MNRHYLSIALFLLAFLSGCTSSEEGLPTLRDRVAFTDVTAKAGLDAFTHQSVSSGEKWFPEIMGAGGGFIDFNNDAWPDILLVNGGLLDGRASAIPVVSLYQNNKDGTFENVTEPAGLSTVHGYGFGLAVADYDNDGDEDFTVTTLHRNLFFRNENGRFVEDGIALGLPADEAWSTATLFFDADNDGWVDLLIGNYVSWSPDIDQHSTVDKINKEYCTPELYAGIPMQLFMNDGGQRFLPSSEMSGFGANPGKTLGAAVLDFNADGLIDIAVANDTERDLLYENLGGGNFRERGLMSGIALNTKGKASAGMGIDVADIDGSGQPALFIGNFSKEMVSVFQHQANGRFRNVTTTSGIGRPSLMTLTFGLLTFDVELDGDTDLFILNGHVHEGVAEIQEGITFAQRPQLFLNAGDGNFEEFDPDVATVFDGYIVGRGAARADFDGDGDVDILITTNNGSAQLWRNDSNGDSNAGNALQVTLEGSESNSSALGARVELVAGGKKQVQYVKSGSSYLTASELRLTFGLNKAEQADSLLISWPAGSRDTLLNIPAGQHVFIKEGFTGVSRQIAFSDRSL